MTYFTENPLPILFVGIVAFVFLLYFFMQTRKRLLLILAAVAALLTVAVFLLERSIVTEVEEIELTLKQIELDLESNDRAAILSHIVEDAVSLRKRAEFVLNKATIQTATIKRNLKIQLDKQGTQKSAKATFNGVIKVDGAHGEFKNQLVPRFFTVNFVKDGNDWKVARFKDEIPTKGTFQSSKLAQDSY